MYRHHVRPSFVLEEVSREHSVSVGKGASDVYTSGRKFRGTD